MAHPYGSGQHQMVIETTNNARYDEQQRQEQQMQQQLLQQNYLQQPIQQQIDVRMKRHPELQPYVPSDRAGISTRISLHSKPVNKMRVNANLIISNNNKTTNDAKSSSSTKPKKCVSMTRLDQLAQPKKVFTRNSISINPTAAVASSSLSSSTTNSSLASNRNYNHQRHSATNSIQKKEKSFGAPITNSSLEKPVSKPKIITTAPKNGTQPPKPTFQITETDDEKDKRLLAEREEDEKRLKAEEERRMKVEKEDEERRLKAEKEEEERKLKAEQEEERRIKAEREFEERRLRLEAEEENRRLKAEEEMKEVARREEEERQNRQLLVDSILSRFNQSS